MEDRKIVYKETAVVAIGQAVCLGLMLLCYYLLDRFNGTVLLSGILGTFLAVGNFFFMAYRGDQTTRLTGGHDFGSSVFIASHRQWR